MAEATATPQLRIMPIVPNTEQTIRLGPGQGCKLIGRVNEQQLRSNFGMLGYVTVNDGQRAAFPLNLLAHSAQKTLDYTSTIEVVRHLRPTDPRGTLKLRIECRDIAGARILVIPDDGCEIYETTTPIGDSAATYNQAQQDTLEALEVLLTSILYQSQRGADYASVLQSFKWNGDNLKVEESGV